MLTAKEHPASSRRCEKVATKLSRFVIEAIGERLFVFEAPVDLLSFLCLYKKDWAETELCVLGGVSEKGAADLSL
jgi:hypothetical protein